MATETLGAASELDAINELLASVGEEPVEDLENLPPSGTVALRHLRSKSRDLQEEGWWFNKDESLTLTPDVSGEIALPINWLDVDGVTADVTPIGSKLFSNEDKSYTFTDSVELTITYHRPWDELPSVVRRYITALALEAFVEGYPGADPTSASRQRNLQRATVAFKKAQLRSKDYNILQSAAVQTLLRRS